MSKLVRNALSVAAVVLLIGGTAFASIPEIDPSTGTAALVLLAGALTVIRSWRRR